MSIIGRNQLSINEKAFKYEFSLQILGLKCQIPFPTSFKFMWKRNSKGIESKSSYQVASGSVQLTLNQRLSSISTIIFNTEKREFLPKESELIINMYFKQSPKKLASCKIDMRTILDTNNYKMSRSQTFQVQLKPSAYLSSFCKLQYKLSSIFKEELVPSQRSIGSGTLNMSGLSIQPEKYFEKKYEVPSKDNYSVTSYNTVGRHPSANKRDQSSIRKLDYGTLSKDKAYLTGLKSNITNTQGGDFDTKSGFKSIQNKTQFGEGNYLNRQLIEQQNKRSRAEAELNKNTVQIGELKKKINQLVIENLKLKESAQNASKEQLNALQFKIYELNKEAREASSQLDLRRKEYQAEAARFRTEKSTLEAELLTRQKRIEELQRTTLSAKLHEQLQNDNRDLKYQVENLRNYIQQINRQNSQQQEKNLREIQQLKNLLSTLQSEKDKLAMKERESSLKEREMASLSREIEEYKSRLSRYQNQKATLQRQIIKLSADSERNAKVTTDQLRTNQQLRFYEVKLDQAQRALQKVEEEKAGLLDRIPKLLTQMNELQKKINESEAQLSHYKARYNEQQNELNAFKTRIVQLQNQNNRIHSQKQQSKMYASSTGQVDRLMRQSLQQQVQLKFVKDELSRLQHIEELYENEKWRADKESSEREILEKEHEQMEKDLTSKNRALMIEIEKTKHMNEERAEALATLAQYKDQLEKNRNIIYVNDQQNLELKETIRAIQGELGRANDENRDLRLERQRLMSSGEEIRNLQMKVAELQGRDAQKLETIQNMNRNCMLAQNEIKELQNRVKSLQYQLGNKQKLTNQLDVKSREFQRAKSSLQSERNRALQDLRQQQKKNRMIMQQIHGMKKKLQEEKGRSVSFTRVEESNRIRDVQAALEKKDKMISKLNKEKLELEEENIKKNVEVMKLLTEMEKLKATTISGQSSLKNIGLK